MTILDFVILALATWRISNLFVDPTESGPFGVLHKIRYAAGVRYDEHSEPYGIRELGKMLSCLWCTSLWVGLVLTLLYWPPRLAIAVVLPFALSAATLAIGKTIRS